jgi:hypothetical protein
MHYMLYIYYTYKYIYTYIYTCIHVHIGLCSHPILRGNELLGHLILQAEVDVTVQAMSIHAENKRSIAFFKSNAPNHDIVRKNNPQFKTPHGTYSIELKCRDICNLSEEVMTDACFLYVRACLNIEEFTIPREVYIYIYI